MTINRIGFLVSGDETYGVSRFIRSCIGELTTLGIETQVISLAHGPMATACAEEGANVQILGIGSPPNYQRGLLRGIVKAAEVARFSVSASASIATALRRFPDMPLIVRHPNLVPMAGLSSRKVGTKCFWIIPNSISSKYPLSINKALYDLMFRLGNIVPVANSHYTYGTVLNFLVRAEILHLGVRASEFSSNAEHLTREQFGLRSGRVVAGIFARLLPEKGQDVIIRALAEERESLAELDLLICGGPLEGAYAEDLRRLISRLGLDGRVALIGPRSDIADLYPLCDLVLNSRITPEPFGLSIIEAMFAAKPVIAHAAGGPSETIVDTVTGWLIQEATPASFARGFQDALARRPDWEVIGANGRKRAEEKFEISVVVRHLLEIIERRANLCVT